MPAKFKGLSEYKRNFSWNESKRSRSSSPVSKQKIPWAGVPSELLGNTREPNFTSKKRVPYYSSQVSQSFHWNGSNNSRNTFHKATPNVKLQSSEFNGQAIEKSQGNQKECETPDGPRKPKVPRSRSADCHLHSVSEPTVVKDKNLAVEVHKSKDNNISWKKEVADKAVGNDVNYALLKKSGLKSAPRRSLGRSSEYQRQFAWKNQIPNSPLLAAEQIIYTKNPDIPPLQKGKMTTETEYSSQFKGMQPPKGPRLRKDFEEEALAFEMGSLSPLKLTGSTSREQNQETEMQGKQCQNEQKSQKPAYSYKGLRKVKSEYKTNFRSPVQYEYRSNEGTNTNLISPWYAEVKELREKAEAYKRRALGTHFSRDHLTQILSEQNKLWDVSSTSDTEESVSDCIKALDLARARETPNISSIQKNQSSTEQSAILSPRATKNYNETVQNGTSDVPTLPVSRKLAWSVEDDKPHGAELREGDQGQNCESKEMVEGNAEVEAVVERETAPVNEQGVVTGNSDSNGQSEFGSDAGGRLPTPKLKATGGVHRTHHDLTTPAIGGAVLVAPRQVRSPSPHRRKSQPPLGKSYSHYKHISEASGMKKTELLRHSPAAGVLTHDPIPLREECMPADYSTPSYAKTLPSVQASLKSHPPFDQMTASITPSLSRTFPYRIQGTLRHPEFQHNGNTGGPRTNLLKLQATDPDPADNEDDRMSQISARSAASSSLASQVLERAQKRRDNFWGKSL
ncbi:nuclear protein MDM1 isoform X1 [Hemitrygon akajei]|uniref:nuclear protein MDM1 isoform X1 n=1 Tax=Hemitrygon akajei TaxID=2704970 RepID=UPI003BFA2282